MSNSRETLLSVKGLKTYFDTPSGVAKAVDGLSFDLFKGETLGIVGESGSGKSVTSLSLMRLIPNPPGKIVEGEILYRDTNILNLTWEEMRELRGRDISMIFQEPMTSLNPVYKIGFQVMETLRQHEKMSKAEAFKRAVGMLEMVGIPDAEKRMDDYPHQFSGGMRQRVMIAQAMICNPSVLIADEPTTALDVTIQAQILELMMKIRDVNPDASVILITHDLAVVAEHCDRVIVMYGGKIQEVAPVLDLYETPKHPYTRGLMESIPGMQEDRQERLHAIRGNVPDIHNLPVGCKFCTRCDAPDRNQAQCEQVEPSLTNLGDGREVRCHLYSGVTE